MILAAFSAFATVAAGTSTSFREDVRSVGILLYSEILKDESNEIRFSWAHLSFTQSPFGSSPMFFVSLTEAARTRLLGVLLPTISLLLANSQHSPSPVIAQSINLQLLSYATISPTAFKEAASKLDAPTRELLETSIRRAVGGGPHNGRVAGHRETADISALVLVALGSR
ncbi:hypothetical protein F5050DRAFT_1807856 [Lentinula boryana]|uniref:LAA1-like C-terminal TPR repeats domain-containing protein n=1 Tax=Lentinula boryana TaxID=40481 RepID=A0ABQ8QCP1_9AGAR|nr:hypothetical protein F5050DRAFT_1807856 [Lentinula boryana]